MLGFLKDRLQGKVPWGSKRSDQWPLVRAKHLKKQPRCALCGGNDKLQVHHMQPFHLHPELELDPRNLITLCESKKHGVNCHLLFGHLGNFTLFNPTVIKDTAAWNLRLERKAKKGK